MDSLSRALDPQNNLSPEETETNLEFTFQFLNDKIHIYVLFDITGHFKIEKLKNKHIFLKKKQRKLNYLILTKREETKTQYFAPKKFPPARPYLGLHVY